MENFDKNLEKRVVELESLLRTAEDNASLGVWEWDLVQNVIKFSEEAMEIMCLDPESFDGTLEYISNNVVHEDFKDRLEEAVSTAMKEQQIAKMEYRLSCPNGVIKWVRVNGVFLKDNNDQPLKMTGMIQDISALKYYETQLETDAEFLDTLMDIIQNPIFYKDAEGRYQFCNTAFSEYLGLKKEIIIGSTVYDVAPSELADVYHKADLELMKNKEHQVYEAQVQFADGSYHDVIFNKAVHTDYSGEVMGLVGVMLDITKQNQIKQQIDDMNILKDALLEINQNIVNFADIESMFEALLKSMIGVITPAESGCVIEVKNNSSMVISNCYGFDNDVLCHLPTIIDPYLMNIYIKESKNKSVIINCNDYSNDLDSHYIIKKDKSPKSKILIPIKFQNKLSYILTLESTVELAFSESDIALCNYVLEQIPIMNQVFTLYQKTLHLSQFDALTDLMNRHHFASVFKDRLAIAEREKQNLILASFDLDGLKNINDSYGHLAGDLYITTFADHMLKHFRKADRFARTGGDEFAALFLDADAETLFSKLKDIQKSFQSIVMKYENIEFSGGFSFGIALYPDDSNDITTLEKLADYNMYENKNLRKRYR